MPLRFELQILRDWRLTANLVSFFTFSIREEMKTIREKHSLISYNLGQNGWKIKTTPPPISMMEKMARFRCSASTSLNWGKRCFYFSFYSVQDCNLGQNGWKIKTTPPSISMMEKMARFRCSASTSLNWGEGGFYFSFYSVQDCSHMNRKSIRGLSKA